MRSKTLALILASLLGWTFPIPVSAQAQDQSKTFFWGAGTSSYQVEGDYLRTNSNDYDIFNRDQSIQDRVRLLSSLVGPAINLEGAGEAVRTYEPQYYERDFDYAKLLGLNAFRISLEWSRIEPQKNQWDNSSIDHYRQMIRAMKARGLTPIVTLVHFYLPSWVLTPIRDNTCWLNEEYHALARPVFDIAVFAATKSLVPVVLNKIADVAVAATCHSQEDYYKSLRGWETSDTVEQYVEYVTKIVTEYKDDVDYWLTLNEPVGSVVGLGYIAGVWSPGFVLDGERAKVVLHNQIWAHVRAYDVIHRIDQNAHVGFAHVMHYVSSADSNPDNTAAARNFEYFLNDYFLNAVVNGEEDLYYLNTNDRRKFLILHNDPQKDDDWTDKLDFVGLNYYRRVHVYGNFALSISPAKFLGGLFANNMYAEKTEHGLLNDLGWEIFPLGLYEIIMRIKNSWHKPNGEMIPVLITENGIPDKSDKNRAPFIVSHIEQIYNAILAGANVIGYIHWSLVDNWELHEGYRQGSQFGLFHISRNRDGGDGHYHCGVCHREITEGALAYQYIIKEAEYHFEISRWRNAIFYAKEKFGYFSAVGYKLFPPIIGCGCFWEGYDPDGLYHVFYLTSTNSTPYWMGMSFSSSIKEGQNAIDLTQRKWRQMENITWRTGGGTARGLFAALGSKEFQELGFEECQDLNCLSRWTYALRFEKGRDDMAYVTIDRPDRRQPSMFPVFKIPFVGLWTWGEDPNNSPWGGSHFSIRKLEGEYSGKYLINSSFPFSDARSPFVMPSWREFVAVGGIPIELNALPVFDITLELKGNTSSVLKRHAGSWSASRPLDPTSIPIAASLSGPFRLGNTGYSYSGLIYHWDGNVRIDETYQYDFNFVQGGKFLPFIRGLAAQDRREQDTNAIIPLENFMLIPSKYFCIGLTFKGVCYGWLFTVEWNIYFRTGSRCFTGTANDSLLILNSFSARGSWSDCRNYDAKPLSPTCLPGEIRIPQIDLPRPSQNIGNKGSGSSESGSSQSPGPEILALIIAVLLALIASALITLRLRERAGNNTPAPKTTIFIHDILASSG